jgi:tRNA(fMet)-specific endonuclease VapC
VGFLLDTNVISELVRHPHGRLADRIAAVGEQHVCTSIVVAAVAQSVRKASVRLAAQLEAALAAIDVRSKHPWTASTVS